MARYKTSVNKFIHSVYIADGFADDCDELIYRCMQVSTLSYEKFCDVWKEMDFACIFHGRSLTSELAELSEEVLHVAKHYMVANTSNFEESVAGVFLVYALLNLQPIPRFAALRIVPEDVPAIERIQMVARNTRRLDVLYILGHVLITGPCHYHAVQRERGMEFPIRKYLEGYTTIDNQGIRPKGVFYRQNEELDILRELTRVGKIYKEAKEKINVNGSSGRDLKYADNNFASKLDASLKNLISGIHDDGELDENDGNEGGLSKAHMIKEKAMKMAVKPISHLTGLPSSPPHPSPPSSPPPNDAESNDNPQIAKKRPLESKASASKRRRISTDSESDEDDDMMFTDSDEEIEEDIPINTTFSSTPQNRYDFEIEIIDEYQDKDNNPLPVIVNDLPALDEDASPENLSEIRDALQRRDVILTKVGNSSQCESTSRDVNDVAKLTKLADEDVFKKPLLSGLHIGTREKRDLKKSRIKTRFQRLGMLPMANFVDKIDKEK